MYDECALTKNGIGFFYQDQTEVEKESYVKRFDDEKLLQKRSVYLVLRNAIHFSKNNQFRCKIQHDLLTNTPCISKNETQITKLYKISKWDKYEFVN